MKKKQDNHSQTQMLLTVHGRRFDAVFRLEHVVTRFRFEWGRLVRHQHVRAVHAMCRGTLIAQDR